MSNSCRSFNAAYETFVQQVTSAAAPTQLEQSLAAVFKARGELKGLNEFEMDGVIQAMEDVGLTAQSHGLKVPSPV